LDDSGRRQRFIKTIQRKGFRFVGPVNEIGRIPGPAGNRASNGREPELPLPDRPSVAVLPFMNMSDDPSQHYFAEGMAAEIISALSRCNWLFVIAQNSSFTYSGNVTDIRSVGRELGVRYVLLGGVRRARQRIRFTGQLIEADTGLQIWASTFEGGSDDVFALQDQMTEAVVAALEPSLELAEVGRLKNKPATNLDAYDFLLRAHQLEYEFTEESLAAALVLLDDAVRIDPNYASAMAFAAHCHGDRANFGWTAAPEADAKLGLNLAWRAVELAKDDSVVLLREAVDFNEYAGALRAAGVPE
jgi:TolB-like protein